MEKFAVLTADIIASQKHQVIRETLETKLEEINSSDLLTPFLISGGDEIQAVCINFASLPRIIRDLRYYCRNSQQKLY